MAPLSATKPHLSVKLNTQSHHSKYERSGQATPSRNSHCLHALSHQAVHDGQRVGRSIEGGVRCRKGPHPNRRAEGVAVAGEGVAVAGEERRLHLGGIDPAAAQRGARVGGEDGGEMAWWWCG